MARLSESLGARLVPVQVPDVDALNVVARNAAVGRGLGGV